MTPQQKDEIKRLPCPFCGSERIVKGERYFAMCVDCGATGPERNADATERKYTGDWNTRSDKSITTLTSELERVEREVNAAHNELKDMPIGNEHETYSLARRCELAIHAKHFAWEQMDKARAESAYHKDMWNGQINRTKLAEAQLTLLQSDIKRKDEALGFVMGFFQKLGCTDELDKPERKANLLKIIDEHFKLCQQALSTNQSTLTGE